MSNPVWKKYILLSMPKWLDWFANNHLPSHIQLFEKFLLANPYYVPNFEELQEGDNEFLLSLIYDEEYLNTLSPKGLSVWYYSDFRDFLQTLKPFCLKNKELKMIYKTFIKNIWWYERVYSIIRVQVAEKLESQGKQFKQ